MKIPEEAKCTWHPTAKAVTTVLVMPEDDDRLTPMGPHFICEECRKAIRKACDSEQIQSAIVSYQGY